MVDRPARWTKQPSLVYLSNFIEQVVLPKKISPAVIRKKYLKSQLSASQLAGELGVSKQMILKRLRKEGVRETIKGRFPDNYRLPNPPYGYQVRDSKLISCPREMKIARMVVELRDRKKITWAEIAKQLNAKGYRTRSGVTWTNFTARPIHKRWTGKL